MRRDGRKVNVADKMENMCCCRAVYKNTVFF